MSASATTAQAALPSQEERSESSSEELEPLSKLEILEAYDRLAGPLASGYCGS